MYILEVLSGPLDGKTWAFDREISIGRDESLVAASINLDRYISRRHAHVREDGGRLFLSDLESRNGISVGGPAGRPAGVATSLEIGEPFQVGRTQLRVVLG